MPINENQTIIGVPLNVEEEGELRKFLIRLLEKLDVIFGYRGDDPFVTISQLQDVSSAANQNLTQLEQLIIKTITENISVLNAALDETGNSIDSLKSDSAITDASTTSQTITDPPTQIEVQNIQNQVVNVATQLNALLAALRGTEIIAT